MKCFFLLKSILLNDLNVFIVPITSAASRCKLNSYSQTRTSHGRLSHSLLDPIRHFNHHIPLVLMQTSLSRALWQLGNERC